MAEALGFCIAWFCASFFVFLLFASLYRFHIFSSSITVISGSFRAVGQIDSRTSVPLSILFDSLHAFDVHFPLSYTHGLGPFGALLLFFDLQ